MVPTADEAFALSHDMADEELNYGDEGIPEGTCLVPRWLTVSLDIFGFEA